jgi:uncharacterized protein YjbI with pentapeptide repeats
MSDSEKPKSWKELRQSMNNKWPCPYILLAWICEWVWHWLRDWSFIKILERLGHLAIVVGVLFYIEGCPERQMQAEDQRKAKQYQAWQVISAAQGKPGDLGRSIALKDLHKDGIPLDGVDVSQAFLPHIVLENAQLNRANFSKANLNVAKLSKAVLQDANLSEAKLVNADLSGAFLTDANLPLANLSFSKLLEAPLFDVNASGANLRWADLSGTQLVRTILSEAKLIEANLSGAQLTEADLSGADFSGANLWNSNLRGIKHWQDIKSIKNANIMDVKNPPDGFEEWAIKNGAVRIKDEEWRKLQREKWKK